MPVDVDLSEAPAQGTGVTSFGAAFGLAALGGKVQGERRERIQDSPYFNGRRFENPVTTPQGISDAGGFAWEFFAGKQEREPSVDIPILKPETGRLVPGQGEDLRVTWLGHSSVLLEVDGALFLTDPVFGPRAAPVRWAGPKRFHAAPVPVEKLPPLDAVIISHDHYDHLDYPTVQKLMRRGTRFITALGVGAHLERWGVPADRITELGWWQATEVKGVEVTATPSRHFAGRGPGASMATFWASWALRGPRSSVWFSGDTGPFDEAFLEIGERFGGFDLTLIESGAWNPRWSHVHLGPDNALRVHEQVRGRTFMPVHWGTFKLALHAWDEPIRRILQVAEVPVLAPMMGQTVHRESGVADFWKGRL